MKRKEVVSRDFNVTEYSDDEDFRPPALSAYAMSLLEELNAKSPIKQGFNKSTSFYATTSSSNSMDNTWALHRPHTNITPYTVEYHHDKAAMIPPDASSRATNLEKSKSPSCEANPGSLPKSKPTRTSWRFGKSGIGAPKRIFRLDVNGGSFEDGAASQEVQRENPPEMSGDKNNQWRGGKREDREDQRSNLEQMEKELESQRLQYFEQLRANEKENLPPHRTPRAALGEVAGNILNQKSKLKSDELKQSHDLRSEQMMRKFKSLMVVNTKQYEKLELIGRGGSSKVFKCKNLENNKVYAIKRVSLDQFDGGAVNGFKGEINLLSKLKGQERVVKLIDSCFGDECLHLVMECGDIDLAHVLSSRLHMALDLEFVRYHASEILKCVKAVHDAGVVHSDLKPANFLFVKGVLKIIDFGISNSIAEHTINVYRESQIGTPNYMAPEALMEAGNSVERGNSATWKIGKPSDVWSCGCIIYQMVYGRPPYASYSGNQRIMAIMNPEVKPLFPSRGLGEKLVPSNLTDMMKDCLRREPENRLTVDHMLQHDFIAPKCVSEQFIKELVENAVRFGVDNPGISSQYLKTLGEEVWRKVKEHNL